MDPMNESIFRYLVEISSEIKKIKFDIADIKNSLNDVKTEQDNFMNGFPNGIDSHRKDHTKKKKWFF